MYINKSFNYIFINGFSHVTTFRYLLYIHVYNSNNKDNNNIDSLYSVQYIH